MDRQAFIRELDSIVRKHNPTPAEFRYALKTLREGTGLRRPRWTPPAPRVYTPAEVQALLDGAATCSPKHQLLVRFLLQTGLGISEFHKLDLSDIDADTQQLRVRDGEWDRTVPLSSTLYGQIRLFAGASRSGPIFDGVSVRTLQRRYAKAVAMAGIENKHGPHIARHTFAIILRAQGVSLEERQRLLGLSSKTMIEVYAKLTFTPDVRDRYLQLFEGGAYKL